MGLGEYMLANGSQEVDPQISDNLIDVINLTASAPDMGAVYILLGSMTVSGLVIIFLIAYCTAHCWRKKCFKRGLAHPRRRTPRIRVSNEMDNDLTQLKHTRMTAGPSPDLALLDDRRRGFGSLASRTASESDAEVQSTAPPLVAPVHGCYRSRSTGSNGAEDICDMHHVPRTPSVATPQLLINGRATTAEQNSSNLQLHNVALGSNLSVGCDTDDQLDKKSTKLHYDLRYCDAGGTLCGFLTFALRYDHIHRVLMLHVLRANDLTSKAGSQVLDPYVKIYLLPERRYHCKTRISKGTWKPEFNEMFSFDVPYSLLASRMFQFTVYNFDRFKRHDLVGNVIMRDLFEKSDLFMWTEYTMQVIGNHEKDDYGDVLFYTSYDKNDEKFLVTVSKAYNLRPMDITGASDPYLKIIQITNKKRIRTKKTTMKRANLNPVYNETLIFDLDKFSLNCTDFLIKIMDWDRIGRDDLLGSCVIGPESPTQEGREQWRLTMEAPNTEKTIGMWHSLLAEIPENFTKLSKRKLAEKMS